MIKVIPLLCSSYPSATKEKHMPLKTSEAYLVIPDMLDFLELNMKSLRAFHKVWKIEITREVMNSCLKSQYPSDQEDLKLLQTLRKFEIEVHKFSIKPH